jgi:signal transduction histidine kinase
MGARENMTFVERSRLAAQNAGAWLMLLFGGLFMVLNALQGTVSFVGMNSAFMSVGALSLWLAAAGFQRTALTLLSAGSCLVFFFAGVWFRNGMENFVLVTLSASLLLLDRTGTRWALAGLNGAAFLYAKVLIQDGPLMEVTPPLRYGLNILLFLLALAGIIEFFRVLNSDYLQTLETANRKLAEANRAKEKLFSVIAHDLRGPVGNLKASLDMLGSGALQPGEFEALVSDLAADVDKSHVCLENLLCWSATQLSGITAKPEPVLLRDTVDEVTHLSGFAMNRKNLQFTNLVPQEAQILVDPAHFQAILRNLISNAVKFTPSGGRILVEAEMRDGYWILCLTDTGVGMPAERAALLFRQEDITSTPGTELEKGFGLGLDICREFVALNHGVITAESAPSQGTKVFLSLPAAPDVDLAVGAA